MNKTGKTSRVYYVVIGIILAAFLIFGALGLFRIKAKLSLARPMQVVPMAVKTITAELGVVEKTLPALATVKSAATIQIKAEVGGKVLSLPLREGDRVKSGQVIGVLDGREQDAQLQAAKARSESAVSQVSATVAGLHVLTSQLDAAQTNFDFFSSELKRNEALFKEGAIAQSAYENTKNRHAEANSRLAALKSQIQSHKAQIDALVAQKKASEKDVMLWQVRRDYTELTAPVDGIVSARLQEVGNRVLPGQAVYSIEDVAKTRLIMQVPQEAAVRVKISQVVLVKGYEEMHFQVSRIYPVQNELRQVVVEAEADHECRGLVYDMQIPVQIIVDRGEGTVVPEEAAFIDFNRSDRFFVYVIKDSMAARTSISALLHGDNGKKLVDTQILAPGAELAVGSYLENIRLPASFAVEVVR